MRNVMTFDGDFSNEPGGSASEEAPPGKDIAELFKAALVQIGLTASAVEDHDSYGWAFTVKDDKNSIWIMLQLSDNWLLITQAHMPFLNRIFGGSSSDTIHRRVCEALHSTASGEKRIRNIRWYSLEEFQSKGPGAGSP